MNRTGTLSPAQFFHLKHAIDDEVARLGWSKERCIVYTQQRYGVRSRNAMTDDQLRHLLVTLRGLTKSQPTTKKLRNRKRDRRRKGI